MIAIVAVEDWGRTGFIGIGYSGKRGAPRLGWFTRSGEFVHSAGSGYLKKELESRGISDDGAFYLKIVEMFLKDSQNDCLRARGDIRWRVMSRAQSILLTKRRGKR